MTASVDGDTPGGDRLVIALDGPAGSGKSTVARLVADRLGLPHVDTGAYYRAATLIVLRAQVDPADAEGARAAVAGGPTISRRNRRTFLDDEDVEQAIRGPEVTAAVSAVAGHPDVREAMLRLQRDGLARYGGVLDGRDAATVIAPDADLKVWLDAAVSERARRRAAQADEPERQAFHEADLARRDAADAAQMVRAPDAVVVDTTDLSLADVVAEVLALAQSARQSTDTEVTE